MEHQLKTVKTGRVFVEGDIQTASLVFIALHGYAQLANGFIQEFKPVIRPGIAVVAPEGLHRFYRKGFYGDVVASWMTKEDRETEIKDQSNYINAVLNDCGIDPKDPSVNFIVLGFSQGTSTAVRWFANNGIRPSQLVLWAGSFPHDVNAVEKHQIFNELPVHFVYGNEDPFLKGINVEEKTSEFEKMGMQLKVWSFAGKHVMNKPTLAKIVDSFDS